MKRRSTILALVLTLALCFGAVQAAFAGYGINGTAPDGNELAIESAAMKMYNDTLEAKYELVDTATLKSWVDKKQSMLVIDTMPDWSWEAHRVPTAINAECGDNGPNGGFTTAQKKALLKEVKAFSGTKDVKYYWNAKTKKWTTKKPAAKNWKKNPKTGKKTKTVTKAVKNKKIVVYCGYVKCRRSHEAAKYLVEQGYTKVYRYPGGVSAWGDAGYDCEGTDAQAE